MQLGWPKMAFFILGCKLIHISVQTGTEYKYAFAFKMWSSSSGIFVIQVWFFLCIINTEDKIWSFLNTYLFCLSRRTERAPNCTSIWHAPGWLILAASNKGDLSSWKRYQKLMQHTLQHFFGFNFKINSSISFSHIASYTYKVCEMNCCFKTYFTYCIDSINRCTAVTEHFDGGFAAYICWKTVRHKAL